MKTSNILILSFVALSVVITAVVVNKAVRTVKTASERSADVGESKSGMKELTFNPCHTLHIDGNSKLNVHVKFTSSAKTSVWVENSGKGTVNVAQQGGILSITKADSCVNKVIVELPRAQRFELNSAFCTIDAMVADSLTFEVSGTAEVSVSDLTAKSLHFVGKGKSLTTLRGGVNVKAWDILLGDTAILTGVDVEGSSRVNISQSKESSIGWVHNTTTSRVR
ncbi:hypothetical protein [uncultured Acetobacteroides sp.]|uniref:hypothetical protein n=1 Tax=uncultured Acetobacteroides sp. TaxID=1760811 RepID=UPI0029F4B908|nr:hypothetical protein [uncultured Acetobacteroides sp.]